MTVHDPRRVLRSTARLATTTRVRATRPLTMRRTATRHTTIAIIPNSNAAFPTSNVAFPTSNVAFRDSNIAYRIRIAVTRARIVATSSTDGIMGYEIVEQVEAVFVDGFRRPEEALQGLKAVAAMKGANAVTNVRQERAASGDCCVSGDAVIVRKHGPAPGETDSARTRSTQEQVQEHGSPE